MATPVLVQTDTQPTLTAVLTRDDTGAVLDLTTATSVYFQLRKVADPRFLIDAPCDITSAATGVVEYTLTGDDLDFNGPCLARFLVNWNDGTRQHTTPAISVTVEAQ